MIRVYDFKNYKKYLVRYIDSLEPSLRRGARSRIAETAACQTAYVSQILNDDANFSLDQAEALNEWLGHNDEEAVYFLLLVQYERAATSKLRQRIERQIEAIQTEKARLKNRLSEEDISGEEQKALFCESWIYSAVLLACRLPGMQTADKISQRLLQPLSQITSALDRLEREGFVEKIANRFSPKAKRVFLSDQTAFIKSHHTNWRLKAIESLDRVNPMDLHYSSVITCSREDIRILREIFAAAIERFRAEVSVSGDEELVAYNIDFYLL